MGLTLFSLEMKKALEFQGLAKMVEVAGTKGRLR